ncbi:3-hexulose-6-phosphate synthase [Anoxybacteroides tepidamans]|uniref:3-hexulose-6-phosphate synthase n=1 Tax=Anoxybacteroides tepidamans TaxID=265948 RepID=UPI000485CCD6|nr:3-hexulose-6-phosphate synthase [Anoxybacillus tepidamans]
MHLQLALDRMTIDTAIEVTKEVYNEIDWIEIGTSLIKEFGIESIQAMKQEFPDKILVADMKTMDNAKYECQLCFEAGADVLTVMGAAPAITVETCLNEAAKRKKQVMIDLLNVNLERLPQLLQYEEAIFCLHFSKDQQELSAPPQQHPLLFFPALEGVRIAVAGGISIDTVETVKRMNPSIVIVGSAITKAVDKKKAARELKQAILFRGDYK